MSVLPSRFGRSGNEPFVDLFLSRPGEGGTGSLSIMSGWRRTVTNGFPFHLIGMGVLFVLLLSGCAGTGSLHPHRGEKGVLVPLEDPEGLFPDSGSLTLYLADAYNSRHDGGQVVFGASLEKKLRKLQGNQVTEVCRSFTCYSHAAGIWNKKFLLEARVRGDNDKNHPGGVLVLTRWSVSPLFPKTTVSVAFSIDRSASQGLEPVIDRAVSQMMVRLGPRPKHGAGTPLTDEISSLLARGETDRALRKGEEAFLSGAPHSPSFYYSLYRLEMSAGKPKMAMKVGMEAISQHRASSKLLMGMIQDARDSGNSGRERNLLFEGVSLFPNDKTFWAGLIHQDLRENRFKKALDTIHLYEERIPPRKGHPTFPTEEYAALVGVGHGDEADQWLQQMVEKNWMETPHPSLLLAHAVIFRELQKGEWKKAEKIARILMARGVRSKELYRDRMTALGAMGNSIAEAHVGRQAIARGFASRWIRGQVAYLAQKGY